MTFKNYRNGEVRIKLDSSSIAGEGAYAYSDGWADHNGEEQFILCDKDGNQFGRFGEREVRNYEIRNTAKSKACNENRHIGYKSPVPQNVRIGNPYSYLECGGEWTKYPESSGICECECHKENHD